MRWSTFALYRSVRPGQLPPEAPVSCVFCEVVLQFGELIEWVDGDDTPLCPRCGVDFIVPQELPPDVLRRAHTDAFGADFLPLTEADIEAMWATTPTAT